MLYAVGCIDSCRQCTATTELDKRAPWHGLRASYGAEDSVNICGLSVRSNLNPNVPCCVSSSIGLKHDSSQHNGTVKDLIIAPIICIITMFF